MPNMFELQQGLPSQDVTPYGVLFQHIATSPSTGTKQGLIGFFISVDAPNLEVLVRDKANNNIEGATVELLSLEGDVEQAAITNSSGLAVFFISSECCIRITSTGKQKQFHRVKINAGGSQFMYTLLDSVPVIFTNKGMAINTAPSDPQSKLYHLIK